MSLEIKPEEKFISGSNIIRYTVLEERQLLQVDLQPPLINEKVTQNGATLQWESNGNAHFVKLRKPQLIGDVNEIKVYYSGHPKEVS